ncbi:MAG: alpha/beta hydrolase family protein [Gammaproteobacteria bacterium]
MKFLKTVLIVMSVSTSAFAQNNRIDIIRHDAPELGQFGSHDIGVRTIDLVDTERVDVVNSVAGEVTNYYDRPLTVEVWYPATLAAGQSPGGEYITETRNLEVMATLHGRAVRDAAPDASGPYPLIILSHGYPGNRFLMSHLGENLASKGYVVASIDHTDSTYRYQTPIASTLYNRPLDQRFVLNTMAEANNDSASFLQGMVDADNTGLIGFSMGGYGLLNNIGAGINPDVVDSTIAPPNELLEEHTTRNRRYKRNLDSRIKAAVAIAPWGMNTNFFTSDTLKGVTTPTLFVAGSVDVTAGYENGTRAIFENTTNADRYLLTFVNGGHSVAAPIPMPVEILDDPQRNGAGHYADPVWDATRSNNVLDHFTTVFMDLHLKGESDREEYLDLLPNGNDGVYSMQDGEPRSQHTYWKGFRRGSAVGLQFEHKSAGE